MRIVEKHERTNRAVLRFLNFARNEGISIVSLIAATVLAVVSALRFEPQGLWITVLIITALIAVSGNIAALFRDRNFERLELVNKTSERAVKVLLADVGKRLLFGLNLDNEHTRVTFYGKSASGFVPLARYSPNPTFMVPGRRLYPDDQGTIWDAKPVLPVLQTLRPVFAEIST